MKEKNLEYEKELFERAKADSKAFDNLYQCYLPDVYRFAYSILYDKHDAEDVTSYTFLQLYENIQKIEWRDVSIKHWLFRVARNKCYKNFKTPAVETGLDENNWQGDEYDVTFVDQVISKDLLLRVKNEIQKLDPIEREIITLRVWEEMKFENIANMLEIRENTCKKRFYRAIDKIKTKLNQEQKERSLVSLPQLFTAVSEISSLPKFKQEISNWAEVSNKISNNNKTNMKKILSFTNSKAGLIITAITIILIVTGIISASFVYLNNKPKENNSSKDKLSLLTPTVTSTLTETPTATPTDTPTQTSAPKPTVTKTPTPTANYIQTFSNSFATLNYDSRIYENLNNEQLKHKATGYALYFGGIQGTADRTISPCPAIVTNLKNGEKLIRDTTGQYAYERFKSGDQSSCIIRADLRYPATNNNYFTVVHTSNGGYGFADYVVTDVFDNVMKTVIIK